jgi:hypothetical protein
MAGFPNVGRSADANSIAPSASESSYSAVRPTQDMPTRRRLPDAERCVAAHSPAPRRVIVARWRRITNSVGNDLSTSNGVFTRVSGSLRHTTPTSLIR